MRDVFYDDNINFIFKIPIYFVLELLQKTNSLFEYSTRIYDGVAMCNDIISNIFEKLHVKEYMHRNYVELIGSRILCKLFFDN